MNRNVEGRGGFVGDEDIGVARERHGDHDALAHAAGELVRILVHALLGLGDTHEVEKLGSALERLGLGVAAMQAQALADLFTDLVDRVERSHRVLEDHGDIVAADVAHLVLGHVEERLAAIENAAAMDLARRHGDEAHDGHSRHGLTRTGLADDTERLAAIERVAHAVDRVHHAVLGMEVHLKVVDLEEMLSLGDRLGLEVDVVVVVLLCHGFTHPSS